MRLGLLGGTFDPPHIGHFLAAVDAFDQLELDRLVFIPAATQPLKAGREVASPEDRLEMLTAMVAQDQRFAVDEIEIRRKGLSFTVDTLAEFARRYPDAERFFCIGEDGLETLPHWREPARVVSLARLVILTRSGPTAAAGLEERKARAVALVGAVDAGDALEPRVLASRRVDVSSTEVRDRVRRGEPIRGFVTEAVARCIEMRGLYRQELG